MFFYLRWILILIGVISAGYMTLTSEGLQQIEAGISFSQVGFIFIFSVVAILFINTIQVINPFSSDGWEYPSWTANPFNFNQPLQFFHLASWFFILSGLTHLIIYLIKFVTLSKYGLFILAVGLGVRLGVWLVTVIFTGKFG